MKYIFLLLAVLTLPSPAHSQVRDSLRAVWNDHTESDSIRGQALTYLLQTDLRSLPDSGLHYAKLARDFASDKKLQQMVVHVDINMGQYFLNHGHPDTAEVYLMRALNSAKAMGSEKSVAAVASTLGSLYKNRGDITRALEYHQQALQLYEKLEYAYGLMAATGNLGVLHGMQDDHARAAEYFRKTLAYAEEVGSLAGQALALNNLGQAYEDMGRLDEGRDQYRKSYALAKKAGDIPAMTQTLTVTGRNFVKQHKTDSAVSYLKRSLQLANELGWPEYRAKALNGLGGAYAADRQYAKAIPYLQEALDIAKAIPRLSEVETSARGLYESYKGLGQHAKALNMHELLVETTDSLQNVTHQREVIRSEYKYNYEKQAVADSIKAAGEQQVADAQIVAQQAQIQQEKTQRFALYGGLALLLLFGGFMYNRFRVTRTQKGVIEDQKTSVEKAHAEVATKNKEITDSITYAKRIQSAILPNDRLVAKLLPSSFVLFKPKDIVAGDFYWMEPVGDSLLFAAADCTGHGVPGAMVSVICNNSLNRAVREFGLRDPAQILDKTRELVIAEFAASDEEVADGMDISLCSLNQPTNTMCWAGAFNPLWIVRKGSLEMEEIKADKQPIAKYPVSTPFTTHEIQLNSGDTFYIFSDGFADQFGGTRGKKYKSGQLRSTLINLASKPIAEQKALLETEFEGWRRGAEQMDDVCVIGVQV